VEGVFTVLVTFVLIFFLPRSPDQPKPLLSPRIIRLSKAEQKILQQRLEKNDQEKRPGAQGLHICTLVWKTVCHWRRWLDFVSTFAVFSNWAALTTYTPSIMV
jgi:hypothetical protein